MSTKIFSFMFVSVLIYFVGMLFVLMALIASSFGDASDYVGVAMVELVM